MLDLVGKAGVGRRQLRFRRKVDLDGDRPVLEVDESSRDAARRAVPSGHGELDVGKLCDCAIGSSRRGDLGVVVVVHLTLRHGALGEEYPEQGGRLGSRSAAMISTAS